MGFRLEWQNEKPVMWWKGWCTDVVGWVWTWNLLFAILGILYGSILVMWHNFLLKFNWNLIYDIHNADFGSICGGKTWWQYVVRVLSLWKDYYCILFSLWTLNNDDVLIRLPYVSLLKNRLPLREIINLAMIWLMQCMFSVGCCLVF